MEPVRERHAAGAADRLRRVARTFARAGRRALPPIAVPLTRAVAVRGVPASSWTRHPGQFAQRGSMSMRSSDLIARRTRRSRFSCHSSRRRPISPAAVGAAGSRAARVSSITSMSRARPRRRVALRSVRSRRSVSDGIKPLGDERNQFTHATRRYTSVMNGLRCRHHEHRQ